MARKSRKNIEETVVSVGEKVYNTAVYARLSVEDKRGKSDSDSIENQIYLVQRFVEEKPYLKLCSVYSDNGETGTNFDRPQFSKMMDEVKAGRINCIVVKDLSRFGRNYIETGNYLEKIFPFLGVRFISVNDNYDTNNPHNNTETLAIALKSLIHDVYAKDISKKIVAALEIKQKNGEFIGNYAPYGYLLSPEDKHKFIVDNETAPIIRDIFSWKLDGMSDYSIAQRLEKLGVPSPMRYRRLKGIYTDKRNAKTLWTDEIVKKILQNESYLGHVVQGKTKSRLFQGTAIQSVSRDNWTIVRNMHDPIVGEADFEKVQEIYDKSRESYYKATEKNSHLESSENIFKGLLLCADCGHKFKRFRRITANEELRYSFTCRICGMTHGKTYKFTKEDVIRESVTNCIRNEIKLFIDTETLICKLRENPRLQDVAKKIKGNITETSNRIRKVSSRLDKLYDDYIDGILSKDEYIFAKAKYIEEKRLLQCKLDELVSQKLKYTDGFFTENKWVIAMQKCESFKDITREILTELVDRIEISEHGKIDVFLKYRYEYDILYNYIKESGEVVEND